VKRYGRCRIGGRATDLEIPPLPSLLYLPCETAVPSGAQSLVRLAYGGALRGILAADPRSARPVLGASAPGGLGVCPTGRELPSGPLPEWTAVCPRLCGRSPVRVQRSRGQLQMGSLFRLVRRPGLKRSHSSTSQDANEERVSEGLKLSAGRGESEHHVEGNIGSRSVEQVYPVGGEPGAQAKIARSAPQGKPRGQVRRGSNASYWPRRMSSTSPSCMVRCTRCGPIRTVFQPACISTMKGGDSHESRSRSTAFERSLHRQRRGHQQRKQR